MPEGHTIHRIARDHERHFAGQKLSVMSPQGRFAEGASTLDGRAFLLMPTESTCATTGPGKS